MTARSATRIFGMILLIGNYLADQQQSMQRFANMMLRGLATAGVVAEMIQPQPYLGRITFAGAFVAKWLGYLDKFIFFPWRLKRSLKKRSPAVVHICDHSNAMYSRWSHGRPIVVSCHDLLAVRGALGEVPDTPASATGKYLQRWILSGLRQASAIACASSATLRDAQRLVRQTAGQPEIRLIHHGINYPYRKQDPARVRSLLTPIPELDLNRPFVLHVGSNLKMKNREGALRIFALTKDSWNGQMVFAGQKLNGELRSLGEELGLLDRIVEVDGPSNEVLEALYSSAFVLLYPSRYEGFGWPIIEAQACGCPVVCGDREPMSEVAGDGALTAPIDDEPAFARALLSLADPEKRAYLSAKALQNAERFGAEKMVAQYIELYRSLGATV